jgi:pimeloyl-ACP methyl ester carboxylesterase
MYALKRNKFVLKWVTKSIIGLFCSLLIFIILGASYQFISTKIDDLKYPPQGKLIDVGGYHLHIYSSGKGKKATVVLDAGLGCSSLDWAYVQPEVAKFAQVCSYDRAGYGWSEESPHPRTSEQIAQELHTLLTNAGIAPPYILVGHSFGGVNVRLFANLYPDEVIGIILVDASHELQFEKLPHDLKQSFIKKYTDLKNPRLWKLTVPLGIQRLSLFSEPLWMMPAQKTFQDLYIAKSSSTKYFDAVYEEMLHFRESLSQLETSKRAFANLPLIVLTAGKPMNLERLGISKEWAQEFYNSWIALQKDLVKQSKKGKQIFAEKSDHMILWHQPEIVVEAIREVVDKTK